MTHHLNHDLETLEGYQATKNVQLEPGKYNIITAWINYGAGHEYTIGKHITQIFLHEDMDALGLSGWIEMIDADNLLRNGPIVGQEMLYFKFETDGAEEAGIKNFSVDFTKQPLQLYKIDGVDTLDTVSGGAAPQALTYRLHFCSPELLRNERIKICQTLQGSYSDIIEQILKNYLKTTKTVDIQETTDLKHINVPEMAPFETINWLTSNAEAAQPPGSTNPFKGRAADFYFYETTRGYKFLPAMNEPKTTIELWLGNAPHIFNYSEAMATAINYQHDTSADTLSTIPSGLWGSKNTIYDTFNKSVKKYQSSYHQSLKKEQHSWVNKTPVFLATNQPETNRKKENKTISDFPDSLYMVNCYSSKRISNVNKTSKKIDYPWSLTPPDLTMRRRMQILHACDYNNITIRVHGISALEVGMVVKLQSPDIGVASGQQGGDPIFINRDNNSWIIRQLTHVIDNRTGDNNGYFCDLILSNTLRDTPTKGTLPSYEKSGSIAATRKTPPTITIDHPS